MNVFQRLISTSIFLLAIGAVGASAQLPNEISYQGLVEGASGSVDLVFRIYSTPIGGTVLWSESHSGVELDDNGVFSLQLGSETSLSSLAFDREYWLEIAIDGNIMTPRTRMTASPYAHRAMSANSVLPGSVGPAALDDGPVAPSDGDVLMYDADQDRFDWISITGGGGGILELVEGTGISIDDLSGPKSTISIRENGVSTTRYAPKSVTAAKIADDAIETDHIVDGAITQAKLHEDVSIPINTTASGDLEGNYPHPRIKDGVVSESKLANNAVSTRALAEDAVTGVELADDAVTSRHVNSNAELTITKLNASNTVTAGSFATAGTSELTDNVGIGVMPSGGSTRLTVKSSGTTSASSAISAQDGNGSAILEVLSDVTVGIGTSTPSAGLEISKPGADGLHIPVGSMRVSVGTVVAGAAVNIPAKTTVVEIRPDGVAGSANNVTMPPGANGEVLFIINNDNDPLVIPAAPPVNPGSSAMYIWLTTVAGWQQIF